MMNHESQNLQKIKEILVVGLGNDILSDDAIGPKILIELKKQFSDTKFKFITAACGGLELVEMIVGYKKVVIIDAIKTADGIPGSLYKFKLDDFQESLHLSSFHDVSFLTGIKFFEELALPITRDITIFAVEIIEDLVFSNQLSFEVQSKFPDILKSVKKEIEQVL